MHRPVTGSDVGTALDWSIVVNWRAPDWLKFKNPEAPAVRREAEEDWGRAAMTDLCCWGRQEIPPNTRSSRTDRSSAGSRCSALSETIGAACVWTIDPAFHEGHDPAHAFEATREAAMQRSLKAGTGRLS
jgi:hypothetical protein